MMRSDGTGGHCGHQTAVGEGGWAGWGQPVLGCLEEAGN